MKVCKKCKLEKEECEFPTVKQRNGKLCFRGKCKECRSELKRDYYNDTKEERLAYFAKYRSEHREKANAYIKEWRKDPKNKEKIAKYNATEQAKRKANPGKRNKDDRAYRRKRLENGISIVGWVINKYKNIPCMDCNNIFPFIAMDFDHRPEETKEFNICKFGQYTATPERLAIVMKEISKCDLVCACCHRIRTHDRVINGF